MAASAGYDNDLWASLIMPMAGVARLGSYVAMFLVVRLALPALAPVAGRRTSCRHLHNGDRAVLRDLPRLAAVPGGLDRVSKLAPDYRIEDAVVGALSGERVTELNPGSLPVGATTWILIVVALLTRWALSRLKDRLPAWMVAVRIYVDALWVFLALSFSVNQGLTLLINPGQWITQRRIMVWFSETRDQLFSHFSAAGDDVDTAMWALRTTFGGVAVPLMWLAVAGIVYGVGITADWRGALQRVAGQSGEELIERSAVAQNRVRSRWLTLPKYVRDKGANMPPRSSASSSRSPMRPG